MELKLKLKIKSEIVSLGFVVVRVSLGLHTKTVDDFGSGIDGGIAGNGKLGLDAVDGDDFLFVVMENLDGVLLLLLLLSGLNLGNNDDSFEDPDSVPCAFPLPAFNGTANFFLVG